jgi:hypothetical protein
MKSTVKPMRPVKVETPHTHHRGIFKEEITGAFMPKSPGGKPPVSKINHSHNYDTSPMGYKKNG